MSFSSRLKELRCEAALTQKGLAELTGVSKASICNLEQDRTQPEWDTALKLAKALSVPLDAFVDQPQVKVKA